MAVIVEVLFDARSFTLLGAGPAEAACLALGTVVRRGWCGEENYGFEHHRLPLL